MSKEKLISLTKYSNELKSKLSDKRVSAKQQNREESYRNFLRGEIERADAKIDSLRNTLPADKK